MKNYKLSSLISITALSLGHNPIGHAADYSGSATLASEYIAKRGISLTDGKPALQLDFTISDSEIGHFGIWASNVDFDEVDGEIDYYTGTSFTLNPDWKLGIGIFYYEILGDSSQNFSEAYIDTTYRNNFKIRYNYTDDFSGTGISGSLIEVSKSTHIVSHYHFYIKTSHMDFDNRGFLDDFSILFTGVERKHNQHTFSINYSNTTSDQFDNRAEQNIFASYRYNW